MTAARVVVLLGPHGSGRTLIAGALQAGNAAEVVAVEAAPVHQFGTRDGFGVNRAAALQLVRRRTFEQIDAAEGPVVLISTGLSDKPLLRDIARRAEVDFIAVATPKALCVERVGTRPRGRDASNDPARAAEFHDFWNAQVAPGFDFALTVDGADPEAAAVTLAAFLGGRRD